MSLSEKQLERYARHIVLKEVGGPGQLKLLRARVLVIGAGGLGSPIIMYLAAAGIGTIGIIDDDSVSLSNLQRQIIHGTSDDGRSKTQSAADTVAVLNPDVEVITYQERLTTENAAKLVADYDIIADGSDNFETRLAVNDACIQGKKTLVSGALHQFDGQLAVFKPHQNADDGTPLPCYRCFVGADPAPAFDRSCADQGILGSVAGVIGTLQATEVIKEILGIGVSLAGKLMLYNALDGESRIVILPSDPECPACGSFQKEEKNPAQQRN